MNILKINGTALTGIYVDAAVSFNKPAKRVETFSVPGRNGDLVIDEGTFDNVLISYPVYEKATFPDEFDSIVNWLASLQGYQRIECSNDPNHFRLGRFVVPQTPTAKRLNKDGYYTLTFDCKPQRYLNLGEVPTEIDANPSETYGPADIVSFEAAQEDTISGAEFSIVPQQDLHGYSSPWPAGGGKNLWSADATFSKDNTKTYITKDCNLAAGTYTLSGIVTAEEGVASTRFSFRSATPVPAQLPVGSGRTSVTFTLSDACSQVYVYGQSGTSEQSAATFTDIQVEAGSTATAWTPYSNICPISGFTGAEITDRGVNLWNGLWDVGGINGTTGQNASDANAFRSRGYIPIKPNEDFFFYTNIEGLTGSAARAFFYKSDKTFISYWNVTSTPLFTAPADAHYLRFKVSVAHQDTYQVGINYPSTDTAYHASVGATKNIVWTDEAGTVYGGTLQYLGGDAWRLTKTMESVDMGDLTWTYDATTLSVPVFYSSNFAPSKKLGSDNMVSPWYKIVSTRGYLVDNDFTLAPWNNSNSGHIGVRDSRYTDAAAFTTAVTGTQLVYELATPVTYDLTGEELARIVGQNNIFANCGQSTVVITEPTYFVNPGYFTSKPIIRVYGDGTFRVGDNIITIAAHTQPYIDIDSELQDCYYEDTNMNSYVTFSTGEYPVLVPGQNYILMGSGITKLIITPRWWEL